jgi:hypothetical protein
MSQNCVDAALHVAATTKTPLLLIASRRQIDCARLGGGYVNGWTTETYSRYVKENDTSGLVFLCRDHGGPWQNPAERGLHSDYSGALESSLDSFKHDIDCGFDLVHIDPIFAHDLSCVSSSEALRRAVEIQDHLWAYARSRSKHIEFEFGTEDQNELPSTDLHENSRLFDEMSRLQKPSQLPKPLFVVYQTGTKVMEDSNCGAFPSQTEQIPAFIDQYKISESIELIRSQGVEVKEHNGDFLSDEALKWRFGSGIGGLNVAPEFGHVETKTYLELFARFERFDLFERFAALADNSKKWVKWTYHPENLSGEKKTLLAGHYLLAIPEFQDIRNEIAATLRKQHEDLDELIRRNIATSIRRYLRLLGWI